MNDKVESERYSDHRTCRCVRILIIEVLQVLVIGEPCQSEVQSLEVMLPSFERFQNCEELFVLDIMVEFQNG